jgi:hypothetical protein
MMIGEDSSVRPEGQASNVWHGMAQGFTPLDEPVTARKLHWSHDALGMEVRPSRVIPESAQQGRKKTGQTRVSNG